MSIVANIIIHSIALAVMSPIIWKSVTSSDYWNIVLFIGMGFYITYAETIRKFYRTIFFCEMRNTMFYIMAMLSGYIMYEMLDTYVMRSWPVMILFPIKVIFLFSYMMIWYHMRYQFPKFYDYCVPPQLVSTP